VELYEEIDVAFGTRFVAGNGAKKRKTAHTKAPDLRLCLPQTLVRKALIASSRSLISSKSLSPPRR